MKKLKVWHQMKYNDDIGLRLIRDGFFGVDLCVVDKYGEEKDCICSFSDRFGHVLKFNALLDGEPTKLPQIEGEVPDKCYYKIWHNKHKAVCRLRLYDNGDGVVYVTAVDKDKLRVPGGWLLRITLVGDKIHIERMLSVSKYIGLPLDQYNRLYVEV